MKNKLEHKDDDDISSCIENAVDKLIHYYDQMSPMVGIALMLDPTKKGTYLKKMGWETEWIETAEENFALAYDQYAAAAKGNTGTTVIPQKRNIDEHDA
jgi:hypothetical protein